MRVKIDDNLLVQNSRESCLIGPAGSGANIGHMIPVVSLSYVTLRQ